MVPFRFVIYGIPRVGSNFFISQLNLHPDVLCHYEVFHPHNVYLGFDDKQIFIDHSSMTDVDLRDTNPELFLSMLWGENHGFSAIGYNLFPNQNELILSHSLTDQSQKKVILKRKQILRTFLSWKIALKTGIWSSQKVQTSQPSKTEGKKIVFDEFEFVQYLRNAQKFYNKLETTLGLLKQDYLVIYYEDFLSHRRNVLHSAFEFIGVDPLRYPPESIHTKFKKQNPEAASTLVFNYTDLTKFTVNAALNYERIILERGYLMRIYRQLESLQRRLSKHDFPFKRTLYSPCFAPIKRSIASLMNNIKKKRTKKILDIENRKLNRMLYDNPNGKIDLTNKLAIYPPNTHHSGWNYALSNLKPLHNSEGAIFDPYVEKTFNWGDFYQIPYQRPWIGVIHFPPRIPDWHMDSCLTLDYLLKNACFQQSLEYCKGLFTLSRYHKEYASRKLPIPVESLYHPTQIPQTLWNWHDFESNSEKKVVQIGYFLRRLHSIYLLKTDKFHKVFLKRDHDKIKRALQLEKKHELMDVHVDYDSVTDLNFLSNHEYDKLLSQNIVFVDLYDASANNLIIECIVRNTPILVNRIEPVVEYLGTDYPLYFESLDEASGKISNLDILYSAHNYLKKFPSKKRLTGRYFLRAFQTSSIYRQL